MKRFRILEQTDSWSRTKNFFLYKTKPPLHLHLSIIIACSIVSTMYITWTNVKISYFTEKIRGSMIETVGHFAVFKQSNIVGEYDKHAFYTHIRPFYTFLKWRK